jgi:hypothetical protein
MSKTDKHAPAESIEAALRYLKWVSIPDALPYIAQIERALIAPSAARSTFKGWTFEPADADRDDPPPMHALTIFWGRVKDAEGRFVSRIGEADAKALLASPSSERRPDAPSFEAIMGEGESWREEMQASPSHELPPYPPVYHTQRTGARDEAPKPMVMQEHYDELRALIAGSATRGSDE